MTLPIALTIAGSDSGGGAGIQADLKTFQERGVFGVSALTAVTAQNTLGVQRVGIVEKELLKAQLDSIGSDFQPAAIKTGMLADSFTIEQVVEAIETYDWSTVVVDPVMVAKGGHTLLQQEAIETLTRYLLPKASIVTPNVPEMELMTGVTIKNDLSARKSMEALLKTGVEAVILKGGHRTGPLATDLYVDKTGREFSLSTPRIATKQTHGTGCTFSAALTAELAKGHSVEAACSVAKRFIQAALQYPLSIGAGHGPTNHAAYRLYEEGEERGHDEQKFIFHYGHSR
ncbi:bifunctional hydroxymethylpyrimidine kinase/phosphomethylpyrimidine kinase [Chryseomicrobium sp. FSL W7-1435]|uniref:bifunctional hydroxymethylpyrimidine kinase/phosphomethylpyrimidine kinase n=1 Tax=Chryseomicrobium sp. FSL W7-1435 TaxID=2921704 RepID=UPI003159F354